jgi:ZipA, C-terminal FtsZ-binding domain
MPESVLQLIEQLDLQKALLIVSALIVFALIINNILRTQRLKKRMMSNFAQAAIQESVHSEKMIEPHFGPVATESDQTVITADLENTQSSTQSFAGTPVDDDSSSPIIEGLNSEDRYSTRMDPNIDCVVALKFSLLIHGQEVIEKMSQWPSNPTYRIACEGLSEKEAHQTWESIQADHEYRELQLSIQLANRRGPISKEDLAEFLGFASQLAQDVDAEIDLPPIPQVLSQAQDLDQFAVQSDIQLSFNIVPNMISWSTKDVEAVLIKNGFSLSRDGLFFNFFARNSILFKAQIPGVNFLTDDLQTLRVKSVLFALDVPLVPQDLNPFSQMLENSKLIAQELDGRVLDDNGQVLELNSIDMIVAQLQPIYAMMEERQIPAGSASAARLFS